MDSRKINELRNLGPACERDLNLVGINTADDIRELGVEETFNRMMVGRIQRGEGGKCFNASYLYAIYGAIHDIDWRKIPERQKLIFKALTAQLRKDYQG